MSYEPTIIKNNCRYCDHYDQTKGICRSDKKHDLIYEELEKPGYFNSIPDARSEPEVLAAFDDKYPGLRDYLDENLSYRSKSNFEIAYLFAYLEDEKVKLDDCSVYLEQLKAKADAAVVITTEPMPPQPEVLPPPPVEEPAPSAPDAKPVEEEQTAPESNLEENDPPPDPADSKGGWGWFRK